MSTLIESGVPILYSLEIAERGVGSLLLAEIIRNVKDNVRDGKPLSEPLERTTFFEPMLVQMVGIGEEIGELATMFKRLNEYYADQVETFMKRFATAFEPIVLLFMGMTIGVMVIGLFLPIFQIAKIGG